ncbi:DUF4886 domain-containing protein [Prevotella sp. P6B4]|uniref:DUF4886 domain-containing protein n=1 Tax=Prevotella sp. P6B4 TaxID=1410614 RepID=UPI00350E485D
MSGYGFGYILRSSSLNNEYDLTRDGTHCGYGLAEYTVACCYYESLIAPRCGISVVGNSARIDVSDKKSKYPPVNVTDKNALIAQEAVYLATKVCIIAKILKITLLQ